MDSTTSTKSEPAGVCPICGAEAKLAGMCVGCLASTVFDPFGDLAPVVAEPEELLTLGKYRLLEEIGRGGMGVVYRARQEGLERDVALKVIPAGPLADPEYLGRFRAEARMAAKLHHPNIVAVYDVGETANHAFFSMELVRGGTLAQRVKNQGPYLPEAAAKLIQDVARGIAHAHAASVLHRDLKPSNILLDYEGTPCVADFGLAKSTVDQSLTLSHQALGTPGWLAPEQVASHDASTPGTDVYGLGALLYFCLTGRGPFMGRTVSELFEKVQTGEPVAPRLLDSSIPRDLETIALRCLEKTPERRLASAQVLVDELQRFLDGKPIFARPVGMPTKLYRWAMRKKALALALGTLGCVIIGSAISLSLLWMKASKSAEAEKLQREAAHEELWNSLLQTAKGQRLSRAADARGKMLAATERAAALKPTRAVRDEAIAALAMPEIRELGQIYGADAPGWLERSILLHPKEKWGFQEISPGQFRKLDLMDAAAPAQLLEASPIKSSGEYLTLSAGGKWLVQGYAKGLCVWDVATGKLMPSVAGSVECFQLSTSTDDALLACTQENSLLLLSLPSGQEKARLDLSSSYWTQTRLSPRGDAVAVASQASKLDTSRDEVLLRRYDFSKPAGKPVWSMDIKSEIVNLLWSPDQSKLAVALAEGTILLVDAIAGRECGRLVGHSSRAVNLEFVKDGRYLLSGGWDYSTRVWDVGLSQLVLSYPQGASFQSYDAGETLLLQGTYGVVTQCSLHLPKLVRYFPLPRSEGKSSLSSQPRFSSDGTQILSAGAVAHVWDRASGVCQAVLPACHHVLPMPNGDVLLSTDSGLMHMAKQPTGKASGSMEFWHHFGFPSLWGPLARCNHAALSADGKTCVFTSDPINYSSAGAKNVEVWQFQKLVSKFSCLSSYPPVAINADASLLALGGHQKCHLQLFRANGEAIPLEGPAEALEDKLGIGVAMDPAGTLLVSTTHDQILFWDVVQRKLRHRIPRPTPTPHLAAAFSGDGRFLVVSGGEGELWLMKPETAELLAILHTPFPAVLNGVTLNATGSEVAATLSKGGILLWDLHTLQMELKKMGLSW